MDSSTTGHFSKFAAPYLLAVVVAGAAAGYAVHEHSNAQIQAAQAQSLAAQNAQISAQLNATNSQMNVLAAKVNDLAATSSAQASTLSEADRRAAARAARAQEMRLGKIQTQIETQNQQIAKTQTDLATTESNLTGTQNDLSSTRTELSGSIARTHDELVVLEKKGQRSYFEFDLGKSKDFKREGPMSVSLRKASEKRQYADLMLIVDDRNVTEKHVNLYQPVMFYQPGTEQPVEVVINSITKDHIHGYISAPKYQPSELAAMAGATSGTGAQGQPSGDAQRQKLTVSPSDINGSDPAGQPAASQPSTTQPNQQ